METKRQALQNIFDIISRTHCEQEVWLTMSMVFIRETIIQKEGELFAMNASLDANDLLKEMVKATEVVADNVIEKFKMEN